MRLGYILAIFSLYISAGVSWTLLCLQSTSEEVEMCHNLRWVESWRGWACSIRRAGQALSGIPFSAFWLRSSVVSVLISLISDTRLIEPHDINLIFLGIQVHLAACCSDLRASPWYCTTSLAGAAQTSSSEGPNSKLKLEIACTIHSYHSNCN
jgi:hypothetical protein